MKLLTLFGLVFYLLMASACKKESEPEPHLIVGTWYIIKVEKQSDSQPWTEENRPCRLDDSDEYVDGGELIMYSGDLWCTGATAGIRYGTWRLSSDERTVIYTYDGIDGEYISTVQELTDDTMTLSFNTGASGNEQIREIWIK
ncbi:MAG: lipocalin family protein [Chitinophagales bacterium]